MRFVFGLLLWASGVMAAYAMQVDKAIVHFPADKSPRQDVVIGNPGEEPLFVDVGILTVSDPGTDSEQRLPVKDPESAPLIATPRRLMVPPGGSRRVRLVNLEGHGDMEKVYRVDLRPVAPPEQMDSTGVRVLVGYQLLVFVAPSQTGVSLEGQRDGKSLTLSNKGNVNVLLHEGEQCPPSLSTRPCEPVQGRRLYPGNSVTLALPMDAPVRFNLTTAGETRQQRYP